MNYTYGNSVWKDQLTAYDGTSITYDQMGNPLRYRGMTLTWQKDRELKKVVKSGVSTTYTYNNGGIRTSKTTGGKRTDYYLSGSKIVTMKEGSDIIHFIYDQDGKLVSMRLKGKDYYYLHNSQGDVIGLVDSSGTQVVSYQYDSWGRQISMEANIPSNEEIGNRNPFRYREYYFDAETGLYYLNTRYYDPETGRFVNADDVDVLSADQGGLQQYNLYAYCLNNPINRFDKDGEFSLSALGKGIGMAVTGITAIAAGVAVVASGVAAPLMIGVAVATIGAGALTTVNGASDIGEAITGKNVVRDKVFQGNKKAYDTYSTITATVSAAGTIICSGWMSANKTLIADKKLDRIIQKPKKVSKYSTKKFEKIGKRSSWKSNKTRNGKGYRVVKNDRSIRYNLNGTRFDAKHNYGRGYWVVSSGSRGKQRIFFKK